MDPALEYLKKILEILLDCKILEGRHQVLLISLSSVPK